MGFPCSSVGKESTCSAGDLCLIPGLGRSPGEGNGNPLQYPCLENLMDRGAWWAAVHGITESGMTERLTLTYLLSCVQLFCDPMDCSPSSSSVHGILQGARILGWVDVSFSRGASRTRNWTGWQVHSLPLSHQESPNDSLLVTLRDTYILNRLRV